MKIEIDDVTTKTIIEDFGKQMRKFAKKLRILGEVGVAVNY